MISRTHPVTGESLKRDVRPMTVRIGPFAEEVMVAGWYPEGEGDAVHNGADLAAYEDTWRRLKKRIAQVPKSV